MAIAGPAPQGKAPREEESSERRGQGVFMPKNMTRLSRSPTVFNDNCQRRNNDFGPFDREYSNSRRAIEAGTKGRNQRTKHNCV